MGHIKGDDRDQMTLFPEALDDYVSQENPVRFIDAFAESLDLEELGFTHAVPSELGRPPYNPADLLRLFIYGYLNRLRSSRQLEREANRNVELMWLLRRLAPDFKTLADFRKDNGQAIRGVCREFIAYCRELRLFGGELVAIDGSKFKAVNARHRNFSAGKLKNQTDQLDIKIQEYLDELEKNDEEEADLPTLTAEDLKQKIEILRQRKRKLRALGKQIDQSGQSQVSLTDPDSRSMPAGKGHGTDVAYNVQVTVDSKHKLILDHEVTNDPTDRGHLSAMALRAKGLLGVKRLEAVADMGYYDGQEVKACAEAKIKTFIPKPLTSANRSLGLFTKEDFRYIARSDCYRCPAGKRLTFRFQTRERGRDVRYYATSACAECRLRPKCTRNASGRRITRSVDEGFLEAMERRVSAHPEKLKRRKGIVEHPFGTIKRSMNQAYFLTRGLRNVGTEMSLSILAYDLLRAINILGVPKMIKALA
jgi:transposase